MEAFHILNAFDIPKGAAREHEKDEHGNVLADYTIWTSANDLKAKRFYFRTYENSEIRMVDLTKQRLDGKEILKWSMKGGEVMRSWDPVITERSRIPINEGAGGTDRVRRTSSSLSGSPRRDPLHADG